MKVIHRNLIIVIVAIVALTSSTMTLFDDDHLDATGTYHELRFHIADPLPEKSQSCPEYQRNQYVSDDPENLVGNFKVVIEVARTSFPGPEHEWATSNFIGQTKPDDGSRYAFSEYISDAAYFYDQYPSSCYLYYVLSGTIPDGYTGSLSIKYKTIDIVTKSTNPESFVVSFVTNGGSAISEQEIPSGQSISIPKNPTKTGFVFAGWYSDSSFKNKHNMTELVNSDLTLYAKWVEELQFTTAPTVDVNVTKNADGSYTFDASGSKDCQSIIWKLDGKVVDYGDLCTMTIPPGEHTVTAEGTNNIGTDVWTKTITVSETTEIPLWFIIISVVCLIGAIVCLRVYPLAVMIPIAAEIMAIIGVIP